MKTTGFSNSFNLESDPPVGHRVGLGVDSRHVQGVGGVRAGQLGLLPLPASFATGFALLPSLCWSTVLRFGLRFRPEDSLID